MTKDLSNIIIWTENKPGVFYRILWLFRRKMCNIESATIGHTEIQGVTRFTITVSGDKEQVLNICRQVNKLVNVIKVEDVPSESLVARELALIKIKIKNREEKNEILRLIEHFRGRVINMAKDSLIIEVTGDEDKINAFYENMQIYKILEFVRTGRTALFK